MTSDPVSHKRKTILIIVILIISRVITYGQVADLDTSDYMPLFYSGALEYNLMTAATRGYTSEVKRMINQGADVDATTSEGATALILAISGFQINTVITLLENGADPNHLTDKYETPLFITFKNMDSESAKYYIRFGVNIDSISVLIAEALIRHGADMNFQDHNGATPLNYASLHGYSYLADLLLYFGASIDKKSDDGTTPLMSAIWAGYDDIADLLIQYGANLESKDKDGFTPFLIAAQNGDTLMMNHLMKNGIDIYEKNFYNWDALDIAIKSGQEVAAEWLIMNGNKWNDPGRNVVNYYNAATNYSRKDIINLLEKNNFPSKYHSHFNQMTVYLNSRFNFRDIYTGFGLTIKEPKSNIGLLAGFDTKLWYTRVLVKENPNLYYQYMDKSSVAYLGAFKDLKLTDNLFRSNFFIAPSLSAAWAFGNKFKGTDLSPAAKLKLNPAVTLKAVNKYFVVFSSIDFLNTDLYRIGPIWVRIGCATNFYFDFAKAPDKIIRWY